MRCPFSMAATLLVAVAAIALGQAPGDGILLTGCAAEAATLVAASAEASFLAENDAAMANMMTGMTIKPTGDADKDFALMMIAHHQGAVDMAQAELRHGRNEQLRRIAQEIVVDQLQEITAMRLAIGEPSPGSAAVPTQGWKTTLTAPPAGKASPR